MNKGISFSMGWYGGLAFGLLMGASGLSNDERRGFMLLFLAIFAGIALVFHSWGVNAENDRLRAEIDRLNSTVTQIGQQYHQASRTGHGDVAPKEAKEQK